MRLLRLQRHICDRHSHRWVYNHEADVADTAANVCLFFCEYKASRPLFLSTLHIMIQKPEMISCAYGLDIVGSNTLSSVYPDVNWSWHILTYSYRST